jgi:hypothetical protein
MNKALTAWLEWHPIYRGVRHSHYLKGWLVGNPMGRNGLYVSLRGERVSPPLFLSPSTPPTGGYRPQGD